MSDTVILKLNDGTEILATAEEKNGVYICTDVLQIVSEPDATTGQMRMGFMEFMPYSSGQIAIPTNMAILTTPSEDLDNFYREKFGKIITTQSKIIL
jgi:pyrrolidone-carboxylate peptidase